VTSAVRFGAGFARICALRSRLWTPLDRALLWRAGIEPDGRALSGSPEDVFPPLVRWYVTVAKMYPAARPIVDCLFRIHEIENVKLLWRASLRGRGVVAWCWRPLAPLGTVPFEARPLAPALLAERLARTPYGAIARTLLRSHPADLPAAEIGLDRWAWIGLDDEIRRLPARESGAAALLRLLVLEHDLDLLRRGTAFGLDADLVGKATVVLSREHGAGALARAAAWTPAAGPLSGALPARVARAVDGAADWDAALAALRRARLRACRRAFVGWPFALAPPVALLLLRDQQARAAMSLAAARAAGPDAADRLPLALAAGTLEA
jgi:hypothetical protein